MFIPNNSLLGLNHFSNYNNVIKEWLIFNSLLHKNYILESFSISYLFPPFIDNIVISPYPTASNVDVLFDSTLSLIPHITTFTNKNIL